MPPSCGIETCKRKSRALCHCCNKDLCSDRLNEHDDSINSQIHPLVDEINTLVNQLSSLSVDEVIEQSRQKLDKWCQDSHKEIDRFYKEKHQELQQRCVQQEWTSNEINISTLSSLYRKTDYSNDDWPVLTSNNRFLLLNQYPNLCLFDKACTIIKQCPWEYNRTPDMCWYSTLNCFIIVTYKNEIFRANEI